MTMPSNEPTLGEIGRNLYDMREDLRALRGELVHKDVYYAERRTLEDSIRSVETQLAVTREDRKTLHRMVIGALLAAGLSILVNLIGPAIQAGLGG